MKPIALCYTQVEFVELLWHEYHQAYSQMSYVCQLIDVKLENSSLIIENIEMVGKDGHPSPQEQCYLS